MSLEKIDNVIREQTIGGCRYVLKQVTEEKAYLHTIYKILKNGNEVKCFKNIDVRDSIIAANSYYDGMIAEAIDNE